MDELNGIARVKFHPGKVEEWKRLTEEAMEIVRTERRSLLTVQLLTSAASMREDLPVLPDGVRLT